MEYKFIINGSTVGNTVTYTIPKGVTDLAAEYHKRDMIISQQAARIKELEEALLKAEQDYKEKIKTCDFYVQQVILHKQIIKELEKALEFYADEGNYFDGDLDDGKRARKALGKDDV